MFGIFTVLKIIIWAIGVIFLLLMILVMLSQVIGYFQQIKERKILRELLQGTDIAIPKVKVSSFYGYPHYTVIFKNKIDMKNAEFLDLFKAYREHIQNKHQGYGKDMAREFDANSGVTFTFKPDRIIIETWPPKS